MYRDLIGAAARRLALPDLRKYAESTSSPHRVPKPFWRRLRGEPHYALRKMPCTNPCGELSDSSRVACLPTQVVSVITFTTVARPQLSSHMTMANPSWQFPCFVPPSYQRRFGVKQEFEQQQYRNYQRKREYVAPPRHRPQHFLWGTKIVVLSNLRQAYRAPKLNQGNLTQLPSVMISAPC